MEIPRDWTFERQDIATEFNNHVRQQLPWYDLATGAVAHIARHYLPHGGLVYDIGASTGNIGKAFAPMVQARNARLVSIEASKDMAALYDGPGKPIVADAVCYPYRRFDVAVLFLVAMFIPVERRQILIKRLRSRMRLGGSIIIFDKMEAASGYPATVLWRLALAGKAAANVPSEEILAKELSLSGVQRPLSRFEIGEDAVEWMRFGDFAGWLIDASTACHR